MQRGHPVAILSAGVALVMVGLLDLLTPSDAAFGVFYVVPVVLVSWAYGWRAAIVVAAVASATELVVDSALFRSEIQEPAPILAWNALSSFVAFALVGVLTDRFYTERERWKAATAERVRLLRLLEREFPRPLRAIDWFARTVEEAIVRRAPMPDKLRDQFSGLRHHSRELQFLATDLIRLGRVATGELKFERQTFDLGVLAKEAADETVDRNRVVVRQTQSGLLVVADPESVRHAISAIIGRLIEASPSELVDLLVRESGENAAIEFASHGARPIAPDLELAEMLVRGNGGHLTLATRALDTRVDLHLPRAGVTAAS